MPNWYVKYCGWIPRPVRRVIVGVIGATLLLLAVLGMVIPIMPGFVFVPLALAVLAIEFAWAARWLIKIKRQARNTRDNIRDRGWRFWRKRPHTSTQHPMMAHPKPQPQKTA